MNHKVFLLLTVIALLLSISANAQQRGSSKNRANITLSVKDSLTDAPLALVTAVLSRIDRSNNKEVFLYAISDSSGAIKFNRIPSGNYEISLQFLGYFMKLIPAKIDVLELYNGKEHFDLGEVRLRENAAELNAVTVKGQVTPIKYLGDTIQYNAAAYNLTDSDVLEDFFKKLPGWSVDKNGKITAHGKVVEQITVNGRVFFFNDPVFVSRNLPAKILKNIKLFEKQSERSKFLGIDDGKRTNTVDVSIREDMLNGWLGDIKAGGGTSKRYEAKNFTANFNKYNQLAIIGNLSNLNQPPAIPGMTIFPSGETTDYSIGSSINFSSKKNKFDADISYKLNGKSSLVDKEIHRVNYLKDSIFVNDNVSRKDNINTSHIVSGDLKFKGKNSMITLAPRVIISYGSFSDSLRYRTSGGISGNPISDGGSMNSGKNFNSSISTTFEYIKKTSKRGRSFSIKSAFGIANTTNEGINRIYNRSNQQYFVDDKAFDLSATLSYTEPITKKLFIGANYTLQTSFSSYNKETYDSDSNGNYTQFNPQLSLDAKNTELNQNIEVYLQKPKGRGEVSFFMIGATAVPSYSKQNSSLEQDFDKWFWNINPTAEYRLSSRNGGALFIKYIGDSKIPSLSLMMPVPDNTNPLFIKIGNRDLKSEYSHNLEMTLRKSILGADKSPTGVVLKAKASIFKDRIMKKSWFDEEGVQYSMPFNKSGDYSITSNLFWAQPIFKGILMFENRVSGGIYNNTSFVNGEENITKRRVMGESIRLTIRLSEFYISAVAAFNYEQSVNSVFPDKKTKTWRNSIEGFFSYSMPLDIQLRTDFSYQYFNGYTSEYDKPYFLWNARITRPLIKNKLIFSISANDILNQNKNVQREVTDFYIQETRFNIVRQYVLFSFTYKFLLGGKSGAFRERANSIIRSKEMLDLSNQIKLNK